MTDGQERINDIGSDLDDLTTTVEEMRLDPPDGVETTSLDRLKHALDDASAATDELEDQQE